MEVASRQLRTSSLRETRMALQRARRFTERYDVDKVNPDEFLMPQPSDFDDLLSRIK